MHIFSGLSLLQAASARFEVGAGLEKIGQSDEGLIQMLCLQVCSGCAMERGGMLRVRNLRCLYLFHLAKVMNRL